MPKAMITMTIKTEYEIDPQHLKEDITAADRLEVDVNSLLHNPASIFEVGSAVVSVKGEILADSLEDENQLTLVIEEGSFNAPSAQV